MKTKRAWGEYRRLSAQAEASPERAEAGLRRLLSHDLGDKRLAALCHNDLGVLLSVRGDTDAARHQFATALDLDPECEAAQANLARAGSSPAVVPAPSSTPAVPSAPVAGDSMPSPLKIALVGLLFNWPSSGGGVMHTVGLGKALRASGCEVKHFYARYPEFGVGRMEAPYPLQSEVLEFDASSWHRDLIKQRFRQAVDSFGPEVVVVTDAWNFKPHLVEAMQGYSVLMRLDGQECLCPLNNCRFLAGRPPGTFSQCPYHQLATPKICGECVASRGRLSGQLHRDEREIAGVGQPEYLEALRRALWQASAVLVNNPLIEAMLSPYARRVAVIPPGVEATRFPWRDDGGPERAADEPAQILMAGVIEEPFKGFDVLHQACQRLWQRRQDFRLVATASQAGQVDAFTRFTGWLSQDELPACFRQADICVVPSIVQEGWATVGVEAMAAGRPLVASRIGGLQFMVSDGATGSLCEPGDADELAHCLERLLDDSDLRRRMGRAARARFEERCSWEAVLSRHYRPLLEEIAAPAQRVSWSAPAAPTGSC